MRRYLERTLGIWLGLILAIGTHSAAFAQDEFKGQEDLDKAFELRINVTDTRDLDKIVELCDSALEKGLSEANAAQAKDLMAATLVLHAEQLSAMIFGPEPDRRWRVFRRDALSRLKRAVELKPEDGVANLLLARLQALDGGDREEARAAIERAIAAAGDSPADLAKALVIRAALAEEDDARLNDLNQAVKIDPSNLDAIRSRALLYAQMEQPEKSIEDFKKWMELEPENMTPALLGIQTLLDLKRDDDARALLDSAIEKAPESSTLLAFRARLLLDKKENELALKDAESALAINKDEVEALFVRAIVLSDKKEHDAALQDIDRVVKLQPGGVRGLWIRGLIRAAKKDYAAAIEDVAQIANSFPDEPVYQMQLAALYNANDEPAKSLKIYDGLLEKNPDDWELLRGRGDAYLSVGDHKKAVADYSLALENMPTEEPDDGVYNNLAWVLSTSTYDDVRDGKRAIELALKAAELTEYKMPHILSTLASSYAEAGDFENAEAWGAKAVNLGEAEESDAELMDNLRRELEAYKQKRAWREKQEPGKKEKGFPAALPGEKTGDGDSKAEEKSEKDADGKSDKDSDGDSDGGKNESFE